MSTDTIRTLADKDHIRELRARYGRALDARDWSAFAALFTPHVHADFAAFGGPQGSVPREALVTMMQHAFRREGMRTLQAYTGLIVEVEGDRARCTSQLHGHHFAPGLEGGEVFELRALYYDELVRSGAGWTISATRLEVISVLGNLAMVT